ncbi:hypothetical protein BH18CHL2_BH18CHL2_05050 [soil metagenome]
MDSAGLPLLLVVAGVVVLLVGLAISRRAPLGLGRLPGDVRGRRGPVTFYAPLGTSLLLSLLLTVVLNAALCGGGS